MGRSPSTWSARSTSGGPVVNWTAATLVPIASTANTTRPPRTSVRYTRSVATSRLGVYRKSSCWKGAVWSAMSAIPDGVDPVGVRAAEKVGDAVGVGHRALLAAHPAIEDRRQAAAEQQGAEVVEL